MRCVLLLLSMTLCPVFAGKMPLNRVQKYAAYKAHTILPETLRFLVKKNGKHLFEGMDRGLRVPLSKINDQVILREAGRITALVDSRANFPKVVRQMGFVAGLVAVYTNPSHNTRSGVQDGFAFYLNLKLNKCLFVFDGYSSLDDTYSWLRSELRAVPRRNADHRHLLEDRYKGVDDDIYHRFNEQDAVFGVSSIYFSNMARLSAHLWYYAWGSAHGDLTRMPFKGEVKKD